MKPAAAFLALMLASVPLQVPAADATVTATPVRQFSDDSATARFGQLEFLSGLTLTSANPDFHSLSAIRFLPDGETFVAVADTGYWIDGTVTRDAHGRLSGLTNVTVTPMKNANGVHAGKSGMDAESLDINGNRILVGFEGRHRIDRYPLGRHQTAAASEGPDYLIPSFELRSNGSFEALATNQSGKTVVIAEKSIDTDGNLFAAIIEGPKKGLFKVVKRQGFDVTDAVFLPDGDLLVLERRFSLLSGVAMRIRKIEGASVRPGALVDGKVLMQANGRMHHIDNMEGIDVIDGPDGTTHLILVSDDNASPLQKTLLLEFRLIN